MGMNLIVFLFLLLVQTEEVPYKPKEEFEIKLDYQFKQRPATTTTYNSSGFPIRSEGVLPYLLLNVKILKAGPGEMRYRVFSNLKNNLANKRLTEGAIHTLDLGFTADVKDGVNANEYTIVFLSEDKQPLTRIFISILPDGSFFVNGEKRGKF